MKILGRVAGVAIVLTMVVGVSQSGEEKDLRAIIAKGIKAMGAEGTEAKYKAATLKGAGTYYGLGEGIPYSAEWFFQGQNQARANLEIKVMNQTLAYTQIVNGDKGWVKLNDEVKDMPANELAEEKEEMYAKWVCSLVHLHDKAFNLAPLGEVKVDNKAATGVRVSRDGKRDVNLFFDKASGLLVKSEHQVKDVKGGGDREMSQETFYADYKPFEGIKHPTKIHMNRDGKIYVEVEMTEVRSLPTLDDAIFAKP
jgi:hypothetical protein